jgi:hypothetical protein
MRGIWTVTLLGVAVLGACGGGSSEENAKKRLEAACEAVCRIAYNPPCQDLTVEQCVASCPYLEQTLAAGCVSEYAAFYECAAGTEYQCTENGPQPVSLVDCGSQFQAAELCREAAPCKIYCSDKAECDGSDAAACETECTAALSNEAPCYYDYEDLLRCQSQGTLVCEEGQLETVGCDNDFEDYASCLASSGDTCKAFCYVADFVECGAQTLETCESTCAAELSDADAKGCGEQLRTYRSCQLGHGLPCADGEPSIVGCSEELYFYQSCMEANL